MQQPVPADESMKHIVTPEGFHVELFADELSIFAERLSIPTAIAFHRGGAVV